MKVPRPDFPTTLLIGGLLVLLHWLTAGTDEITQPVKCADPYSLQIVTCP